MARWTPGEQYTKRVQARQAARIAEARAKGGRRRRKGKKGKKGSKGAPVTTGGTAPGISPLMIGGIALVALLAMKK